MNFGLLWSGPSLSSFYGVSWHILCTCIVYILHPLVVEAHTTIHNDKKSLKLIAGIYII